MSLSLSLSLSLFQSHRYGVCGLVHAIWIVVVLFRFLFFEFDLSVSSLISMGLIYLFWV